VRFSKEGVPTAYLPECVTGAKYLLNAALSRAHTLMGVTQTAKNLFGSVYFEGPVSPPSRCMTLPRAIWPWDPTTAWWT